MSNYRPISLLSILEKIVEKLMYNQIIQLLEDNKTIYYKQFGFSKNVSTAHAPSQKKKKKNVFKLSKTKIL